MTRLLGFGTYDVSSHPRVKVLLDGLAQHGTTVRELDLPLGLSTSDRVAILRHPVRLPMLAARLASRWSALAAGTRAFRGAHSPDAVLVGYMGHFDVLLARALYPRTTIVLDHLIFAAGTARDRGEGGAKARALTVLDRMATHAADVIVLDTSEHRSQLDDSVRDRGVVVPVGAPTAWRDAGARRSAERLAHVSAVRDSPLSTVFFGLYTPLQGAPTIARALRILSDRGVPVTATLIGTGQDRAECEEILSGVDLVTWLDWVDSTELPEVVASHDVCLGIMGTTPKALNVVPNKVYQGLAAGCAVVTSATPPQQRLLADGAELVPAGDATALADSLQRLATDPAALEDARRRARAAAERFTPVRVVEPLREVLGTIRSRSESKGAVTR